ncbi:tripartite tricarboxylate transporter permease [Paracoccus sp. TK19116]|uniref:Tripartite tricarboxylate transporter permease n=1 Tax=Paracoccus albicereus TaxID=2922394 RepID=A0ABT1MV00_9RHOB|nr:tripartite tricarboxylate transporter permease [Paracoccus albicereus]MCQ0971103.1 tripartite tricarboxylate transporter permease [Paracoccus albicereus]
MEYDLASLSGLFGHAFSMWWIMLPAIVVGLIAGAVPGFAAHNTIIILLPLTLALNVEYALAFMVALYCASHLGGGIPAILVNIPGTGGAAATTLDGYPMTRKGEAVKALSLCFVASVLGGFVSSVVTLFALPALSRVGYYIHSVEMVVVMLFGLALIASIAAKDMLKGLIAGAFGLMLGAMGADHIYATPRGTFGFLELFDGVPLVPALIGLFAISEALVMLESDALVEEGDQPKTAATWRESAREIFSAFSHWWQIIWTSLLGLVIGVLPGAGASIASFVAYQQSQFFSKTPEKFGTGHPQGVIAPESANNGVTTGTLVPLLAIGVPGGSTAAVMMIVLQFHGVPFGPRLFVEEPQLAYGVIAVMAVSYVMMIPFMFPMVRYMSRITVISTVYLAPFIVAFTLVGAFVPRGFLFDMGIAVAFGIIGYVARKTGYHVAAILIGVILGPLIERSFLLAMRISGNDPMVMFSSTIGNILWVMLILTLALPPIMSRRRAKLERLKDKSLTGPDA